ncbi:MAG: pyridoxal-phosphate dependent enzyme [Nakamurella sp.]
MVFDSVVAAVGHTPIVRLDLPGPATAYAKLELQNLFAMKDRVAREVITAALASGALRPGDPIIESSSGTMALGLALVGRSLGHAVHIVTDPRIDPVTHGKLLALGCSVHVVTAMSGAGWQSARLELLARLLDDLPGAFWPQQYSNPDNPGAYRSLAAEVIDDLGTVDVLVGAVGSGGSLCGTARALRAVLPDLHVVAVDCVGSMIFGQPDQPQRKQSGLGNSMQAPNVDYAVIDEVHWLSDDEAFAATRRLAAHQQLFAGNSSGSVYQVLEHLAATRPAGTRILGIFPDRGDRYVPSVHLAQGTPLESAPLRVGPAAPQEITYGTAVSGWSRASLPRERPLLAFIESNTTGTGMTALTTTHRLGLRPLLVTADPSRYTGLQHSRADVVVADTADPQAVLTALRASGREVAGVSTTSEYFLPVAAAVAGQLDLPGSQVDAVRRCRDKVAVRKFLAHAGIEQPRWAVLHGGPLRTLDRAAIVDAVRAVGLPCVVKPTQDSGSTHVRLCADPDEVAAQVALILAVTHNARGLPTPSTVLVEEYLVGPEFSVETLASRARLDVLGVTAKTVSAPPHFVETGHLFPAPVDDGTRSQLVEYATRTIRALGIDCGAAHLELRLTLRGPRLVEVNGRAAGGMIPDLVRLATGVDLIEQQLRVVANLPVDAIPTRNRSAGIVFLLAPRDGVLAGIDGIGGADGALAVPGVDRVTVTATVGSAVRTPTNFADRLGYVIALGADADEVTDTLDEAIRRITVRVAARPTPGTGPDPALTDEQLTHHTGVPVAGA